MNRLVLIRHGESVWNRENRFTGWTDVALSDHGVMEAVEAARVLRQEGHVFDVAHTSVLSRAIKTLWIVLEEMDRLWVPVHRSWRLNERHYGALQGLDKEQTSRERGEEQVMRWRRGYRDRPPALTVDDPRYPGRDPRYVELSPQELPLTESLSDTVERFVPCWQRTIAPVVRAGKRVLIVAHGNSLRALVKYLDSISDREIVSVEIPTGIPLVYELREDLSPVRSYYLGNPEADRQPRSVEEELQAMVEHLGP